MMEPGEAIQDRFMLKPLAIAFAAALAVGCGGGGGGGGGGDGDTALTSEQKESVATTSAAQVTGLAAGARTSSETASEIDSGDDIEGAIGFGGGSTSAITEALSQSTDGDGPVTHQLADQCDSGELKTEELSDPNGVEVDADGCEVNVDEDGFKLDLTVNGLQRVTNGLDSEGNDFAELESDKFSVDLGTLEFEQIINEDGDTITIGPISGSFSSDGGYDATFKTDDFFDLEADWDFGVALSCNDKGFDFGLDTEDLKAESDKTGDGGWETAINGTIDWDIEADAWDSPVDEEVTYTTEEKIFVPTGAQNPTEGELSVEIGGDTVTIKYFDGGVEVNGEDYTYAELKARHEEDLGADLEGELVGNCIDDSSS